MTNLDEARDLVYAIKCDVGMGASDKAVLDRLSKLEGLLHSVPEAQPEPKPFAWVLPVIHRLRALEDRLDTESLQLERGVVLEALDWAKETEVLEDLEGLTSVVDGLAVAKTWLEGKGKYQLVQDVALVLQLLRKQLP